MTAVESDAAEAYREARIPPSNTPWREASFSVIDLELTGLNPATDEIISFATVTVDGGRVELHDARYELIRPERMPRSDTIRIHGLREADLADAPTLDESLDGLLEALTGSTMVAHVASIEAGFLSAALEPRGLTLRNPVVDTAALAIELSRLRGEQPPSRTGDAPPGVAVSTPGLGDLAGWLGLPVHRPHEADGDALTTAQAFIALATHLEAHEDPLTVGALQRLGRQRSSRCPESGLLRRLTRRLGL